MRLIQSNAALYMAKTAAKRTSATDPATAKLFETAPFWDGEGASVGGEEIDEGLGEGDGETDDGGGDGGELTLVVGDEAGDVADEDGEETGENADGGGVDDFL